ncbi:hypothetical protein A3Q56_01064 [Intoshia linei]|uniref:Cytochrome c oxidase assembly protein COX11, mitochondrial n=1 Tax=Intoshia linei TaxID=1819745 RepID=A0A177BC18_9BILA|nr:hypothetical protein A3Q56_01064 [Intoshia linei]
MFSIFRNLIKFSSRLNKNRWKSGNSKHNYAKTDKKADSRMLYRKIVTNWCLTISIFMLGFAYAGVPLYQRFCKQSIGAGGQVADAANFQKKKKPGLVDKLKNSGHLKSKKVYTVHFYADVYSNMAWNFRPAQKTVKVAAGETALAFYKAKNPSDEPIIGISTYSVHPSSAGLHFNKIQCFCFEDQLLNAHEEVDLPIFFFLDPDIENEETMKGVTDIYLSYTFFKSKNNSIFNIPQKIPIKI